MFALHVSSDFSVATLSLPESLICRQLFPDQLILVHHCQRSSAAYSFQLPIILQKFLFCNEGSWLLEASQNLWPMIYNIYLMT